MKSKMLLLISFILIFTIKLFPAEQNPSESIAKSAIDSYLNGDIDTAINLLETIIKDNPGDINSKVFLIKTYIEKINEFIMNKNRAGAKNYLIRALKIDPGNQDLKDLSVALDMKNQTEEVKEIAQKAALKKTEEIKKIIKPAALPEEYYSKFISELSIRDEKLSMFFQSGTNKIIRTQKLYLVFFMLFSIIIIVIFFFIIDFFHKKQKYYMDNTQRILSEKLGLSNNNVNMIENKKIKNINIIDTEFADITEFETGKRLLEDYLNDENDKVKVKAILALNKYDRKKSLEYIDDIINKNEKEKLEIIAEGIVDYPEDYAADVLMKLSVIENEDVEAFVYQGLKRIIKSHKLNNVEQNEKINNILLRARNNGWII